MTSIVIQAYDLAKDAHKGQKRRNGDDYFLAHIIPVYHKILYDRFELFPLESHDVWFQSDNFNCVLAAALLHDTVEDTQLTLMDISVKFSPLVVDLVDMLTRRKNESYFDFIMRIHDSGSICVPARAIKIADISCNMADTTEKDKMGSQYAKYELARYILKRE